MFEIPILYLELNVMGRVCRYKHALDQKGGHQQHGGYRLQRASGAWQTSQVRTDIHGINYTTDGLLQQGGPL
jgi:hypothetical protein